MSLRKLLAREAVGYVRSGLLATSGVRIRHNHTAVAPLGVLFVHGVAANPTQFRDLRRVLGGELDWFDAFRYSSLTPLPKTAQRLRRAIVDAGERCPRVLVIGHSLGGLLLRMVLQDEEAPDHVVGYVSICGPLHGTRLSRFAPNPVLRELRPESELIRGLGRSADRLDRWRGAVLAVAARRDHMIQPWDSALLDGHQNLELPDAGHVSSLFDARVHEAVLGLARRLKAETVSS